MMNLIYKFLRFGISLIVVVVMFAISAQAQEEPPRPMRVSTYQHLSFGAFINGSTGGLVNIDPDGSRTTSGSIIPVYLNTQYHPAVFRVVANPGALIQVYYGPPVTIAGSNGGSIILTVNKSLPVSPFINTWATPPNNFTEVLIGGTIQVNAGNASAPGEYSGEFFITFIQE